MDAFLLLTDTADDSVAAEASEGEPFAIGLRDPALGLAEPEPEPHRCLGDPVSLGERRCVASAASRCRAM